MCFMLLSMFLFLILLSRVLSVFLFSVLPCPPAPDRALLSYVFLFSVFFLSFFVQAALQAEINRLRVNLFPETKTVEYTYPSDVVRPTTDKDDGGDDGDEDEDGDGVTAEGQGEEGGVVGAVAGAEGEWKSALLNCGWKETLERFEEMVRGFDAEFS